MIQFLQRHVFLKGKDVDIFANFQIPFFPAKNRSWESEQYAPDHSFAIPYRP
jgi:hypothetical protein